MPKIIRKEMPAPKTYGQPTTIYIHNHTSGSCKISLHEDMRESIEICRSAMKALIPEVLYKNIGLKYYVQIALVEDTIYQITDR